MSDKQSLPRRLLSHLLLLLNLAATLWLFGCYAASVVSPERVRHLALFSLTTPFAIVANVIFIVFWLLSTRRFRSLFSLAALLVTANLTLSVFGFHFGKQDMANNETRLKVMTWNAHGFGIFTPKDKTVDDSMMAFVRRMDVDVLCMPEFYSKTDKAILKHTTDLITENGFKEYRFQVDNSLGHSIYLGTAIFSRYPFRNYVVHPINKNIYLLQGDIILPQNKVIRIYFTHLTTFGLSDNDKAFIEKVKYEGAPSEDKIHRSRSFASRFNQAYEIRASEADSIGGIVARSPYPVILCGDLNDLPTSYTYTKVRGHLNDAFASHGRGLGRTYRQILPTLRIDYIFFDAKALKIIGMQVPSTTLSDHNPVIANFEILD